jgi:hypothetical protein
VAGGIFFWRWWRCRDYIGLFTTLTALLVWQLRWVQVVPYPKRNCLAGLERLRQSGESPCGVAHLSASGMPEI